MKTMCILPLVISGTVVSSIVRGATTSCHSFDSYVIPGGRYCNSEDTALSYQLTTHQCKYICLQSANCAAFNHNKTDSKCTFLNNPCPLARVAPGIEYFVFNKKSTHQCSQWVPYTSRDAVDNRMIASQPGERMVSRMLYNDNYINGYEYIPDGLCFAYTIVYGGTINSVSSSCERLRIEDDCTAFWIPYRAGDPLPARAVTGGRMASGQDGYVVKFAIVYNSEIVTIPGYYSEGAPYAVAAYFGFRNSSMMMMLVIL